MIQLKMKIRKDIVITAFGLLLACGMLMNGIYALLYAMMVLCLAFCTIAWAQWQRANEAEYWRDHWFEESIRAKDSLEHARNYIRALRQKESDDNLLRNIEERDEPGI